MSKQYYSSQEIFNRCFDDKTKKLRAVHGIYDTQAYLNAVFDPGVDALRVTVEDDLSDFSPDDDLVPVAQSILTLPLTDHVTSVIIDVNGNMQNIDDDGNIDNDAATHYRIDFDGYVLSVENFPDQDAAVSDRYYAKMSYDNENAITHIFMTVEEYDFFSGLTDGKNILKINYLDIDTRIVAAYQNIKMYKEFAKDIYNSIVAISRFEVGPALNYGLTQDGNLLSFTWMDPADFVNESLATIAYWGKTRLVMKLGGFPEHEEDGTVLVDNTVRDRYREEPFVYDTAGLSGYYFALFTQTTGGVWNTSDSAPRFTTDDLTWQTIVMMTRAGTLLEYPGMDFGSVVDIQVNTLYPKLRYRLAHIDYDGGYPEPKDWHYDKTKLRNSVWIPYLLPCLGDSNEAATMQFDAPELPYAKTWDEVFITGKEYYKVEDGGYVLMVADTDYSDGGSVSEWEQTEELAAYTKNHSQRVSNGSNNWKESNIRQWLNSSGAGFYEPQNEYDILSTNSGYATGWLTGFVPGFADLIQPVYNQTPRNNIASNLGGGGGGTDTTLDRFWLPLSADIFSNRFDLFYNVTNSDRMMYDESGVVCVSWLRSPDPSLAYCVSYVSTSGTQNTNRASNAYAFLPALCLA